MARKTVLCFASYFLPGFKSGGPVRSLCNLMAWLADDYDFRVVTRNRDLGESAPYAGRPPGTWFTAAGAQVWYLDAASEPARRIVQAVREASPDLIYFQSFLDPLVTILPLLLRRVGALPRSIPVIVAPRGEFSPGALSLKRRKKALYLAVARVIRLYAGVWWHATSAAEAAHIRDWAGPDARIFIAPNLPAREVAAAAGGRGEKRPGELRVAFLSRISPMKNLEGALAVLGGCRSRIVFDIYGTREDPAYWDACSRLMAGLPANVTARYQGVVAPEDVVPTLARYDLFLLPTRGENFGHVILEALLAGCPVLLSDRTPWRDLPELHAGFDLPLEAPEEMTAAVERFAAMGPGEHERWSTGARDHAVRYCTGSDVARPARDMIREAVGA